LSNARVSVETEPPTEVVNSADLMYKVASAGDTILAIVAVLLPDTAEEGVARSQL
jgi:bifunctional ADP-heptose synthase (sugar kinase/adenylyltransferase)